MTNEIDLSKAYAGQIAEMSNGHKFTISGIKYSKLSGFYLIECIDAGFDVFYNQNGKEKDDVHNGIYNIVSLSEPVSVQIARLEGEIKGLESITGMLHEFYKGQIELKIAALKLQLTTLQNENN